MVYKVSKGGVRSGNTLRGLNSQRTKRYALHSCLISRSSLATKDYKEMIANDIPNNQLLQQTLGSTDVILSLNKKQRWQVPAAIGHMISSGCIDKRNSIALLERHKLKRRANCVRYLCNAGTLRSVQPEHKRYFTYSLETSGGEQSNRQRRRIKAEALKKAKRPVETKEKILGNHFKSITVYTSHFTPQTKNRTKEESGISKSDVSIEVFHPCPRTCSLTFNPKYTDVVVGEDKAGDLVVKSNAVPKQNRRKQQHRRNKHYHFDDNEEGNIESDVQQMWQEQNGIVEDEAWGEENAEEIESNDSNRQNPLMSDEYFGDVFDFKKEQETECILSLLIDKARQTRQLCKNRGTKKIVREKCIHSGKGDKSHIVYSPFEQPNLSEAEDTNVKKSAIDANSPVFPKSEIQMDSFQVIMSASEIEPQELRKNYGNRYSEANCLPRRFILNVTDDICNVFSVCKASSVVNTAYLSFLVFTYDGPYDDNSDSYKVIFNSYTCQNISCLSASFPLQRYSISDVMNQLLGFLLDTRNENKFQPVPLSMKSDVPHSFIHEMLNMKIETFKTSDAISRAAECAGIQEDVNLAYDSKMCSLTEHLDNDLFCEICYANINPTQIDTEAGTRTKSCGHWFCNDCWRTHFRMKLNNGSSRMTCPSYNCSSEIGPVTLVSLLHISEVGRLFQRLCEQTVEQEDNVAWCPNPNCDNVIRISTLPLCDKTCKDVKCVCGEQFCLLCMGPSHWPAKCDQAEEYMQKLPSLRLPKETLEETATPIQHQQKLQQQKRIAPMIIEGRICPHCRKFINKNGGCSNMVCSCGFHFCWTCMKGAHYSSQCKVNPDHVLKHTRRVIVRHAKIENPDAVSPEVKTRPKPVKLKQKVSMFQKALQHRVQKSSKESKSPGLEALTKKILKSVAKNMTLKEEVLRHCGAKTVPKDLSTFEMYKDVKEFLKSFIQLQQALHHVVEFTMVLLQNTPDTVDKRRLLKIADDIGGFCSFLQSVLDAGNRQDAIEAVKHLVEIKRWCKSAIDALLSVSYRIKER